MRIFLMSDLHLDRGAYRAPLPPCEVVVAAGDMGVHTGALEFLKSLDKPVVYVAGNHEFWGSEAHPADFLDTLEALREACRGSNVHFLEQDAVVLCGTRFLGTVLWTDFGGFHPGLVNTAEYWMRDYRHIGAARWFGDAGNVARLHEAMREITDDDQIRDAIKARRFHPYIAWEWNQQALAWLDRELDKPWAGETVVVTHHAPSQRSLLRAGLDPQYLDPSRWRTQRWSDDPALYRVAAYASNLRTFRLRHAQHIGLWCHGHLHQAMDYAEAGVRIACNPRGYPLAPLCATDKLAYLLLGGKLTAEAIRRDRRAHARNPDRGDGLGFDGAHVIDLNGHVLIPPVHADLLKTGKALRKLYREARSLAGRLGHADPWVHAALKESFKTRADDFAKQFTACLDDALDGLGVAHGDFVLMGAYDQLPGVRDCHTDTNLVYEEDSTLGRPRAARAQARDVLRSMRATHRLIDQFPCLLRDYQAKLSQGIAEAASWLTQQGAGHVRISLPSRYLPFEVRYYLERLPEEQQGHWRRTVQTRIDPDLPSRILVILVQEDSEPGVGVDPRGCG